MNIRPLLVPVAMIAIVVAAWTWPPSARVLRGGFENNVGYLYLHGMFVDKDPQQALAWYERAASRGLPTAEYNLGYLYQTGGGIPANAHEAARWYELAAAQDHAEAANNLAMIYADGSLGARDLPRARAWLKRAKGVASGDFASLLGANLEALEHDMSIVEIARSEKLIDSLPHGR
jgi:hypothetical protein